MLNGLWLYVLIIQNSTTTLNAVSSQSVVDARSSSVSSELERACMRIFNSHRTQTRLTIMLIAV